jgi:hypothetical protein
MAFTTVEFVKSPQPGYLMTKLALSQVTTPDPLVGVAWGKKQRQKRVL